MGHRLVLVILPKDADPQRIAREADWLLYKYGEDYDLDPYKNECECVGERTEAVATMAMWGENLELTEIRPIVSIKGLKKLADPQCPRCGGKGWYKLTFNYNSRWDYTCVGGKWHGWISGKKQYNKDTYLADNCSLVRDIVKTEYPPSAIIPPTGEWLESQRDSDEWEKEVRRIYEEYADHWAVAVDVHS